MRTFGTLQLIDGQWVIQAEPHVLMRGKRIFQAVKRQQGALRMSATPANSFDLRWFLDRYPLQTSDGDALAKLADRHQLAMASVQGLIERTSEPQAFCLAVPARAYQRAAAEVVLRSGRLLLCDDVGLGKTCSAICVLTAPQARPAVVVTMTHLPPQWASELRRFAPGLRVMQARKGSPTPRELAAMRGLLPPEVIVLSYSKLTGWAETLTQVYGARTVVFDEMQELRRGRDSQKGTAAALLAAWCAFRMGLTATPIYNYGGEIRNVLEFLEEGCLGTSAEFSTEWCSNGDQIKHPKALGSYLRERGLVLRRVGADVSDEVPELAEPIRVPHLIDSDAKAITDAKTSAAELARVLLSATATGVQKMQAAGEIDWRLRQATGIAKAPYVAAFVRMLLQSEERVLLYGWHHVVYDLWREQLAEFRPVFFTGDESVAGKEQAKAAFLAGESRVLVMSLRSGAGVDGLQSACRCVVFGELDWSPGVHEQCIGRIHRPGQKSGVVAYFLHADDGSDPVIVEVLGIKRAQAKGIRDPLASDSSEPTVNRTEHMRRLAESCLGAREREEVRS